MIDLWERIRKRFVPRQASEPETVPFSLSTVEDFQSVISACLPMLHSYPTGTMLYILDCLCPRDFPVLDLVHLDLSQPHPHKQPPRNNVRPQPYEDLLACLRVYANTIPAEDYPRFWLELTGRCLLTCPLDPYYYRASETDDHSFCEKLRSELIERILIID